MSEKPLILITNDDGVRSPGLKAVVQAVADLGDLLIMAPGSQQSSSSRSYPAWMDKNIKHTTIHINGGSYPAHSADVSPAMSVSMAVLGLADRKIDLCLSGINYGENVGSGVTISGTVGAAIEAACYDIPAIAVSLETLPEYHLSYSEDINFDTAARFTRYFAEQILENGLPPNVDLLKIDVPTVATPETGWQVGRISRQRYYEAVPNHTKRASDPKVPPYRTRVDADSLEPDSDVYILAVSQQVAVVPMTIDLTAPVSLPTVNHFFNGRR
jgi:5'-nucleotidase